MLYSLTMIEFRTYIGVILGTIGVITGIAAISVLFVLVLGISFNKLNETLIFSASITSPLLVFFSFLLLTLGKISMPSLKVMDRLPVNDKKISNLRNIFSRIERMYITGILIYVCLFGLAAALGL